MATMKLYELVNHYHIGTELTCDGAMFIPYLTGGDGDFPHVRGTITGLPLGSDQGAMWRCVLEGIG